MILVGIYDNTEPNNLENEEKQKQKNNLVCINRNIPK